MPWASLPEFNQRASGTETHIETVPVAHGVSPPECERPAVEGLRAPRDREQHWIITWGREGAELPFHDLGQLAKLQWGKGEAKMPVHSGVFTSVAFKPKFRSHFFVLGQPLAPQLPHGITERLW